MEGAGRSMTHANLALIAPIAAHVWQPHPFRPHARRRRCRTHTRASRSAACALTNLTPAAATPCKDWPETVPRTTRTASTGGCTSIQTATGLGQSIQAGSWTTLLQIPADRTTWTTTAHA
eukprot:3756704-Prymnesium_polylepis.1